jgi:hypothetical protein
LSSHRRVKHKRKKRSTGGIIRSVKKFFTELFARSTPPKEYRPFLGPEASPEEIEQLKYENTRASKKKIHRHRSGSEKKSWFSYLSLRELRRWQERRFESRRRRKARRKMKAKQRKHERTKRRRDFIRRFFPNYKKERAITIELAQDELEERVKHGKYLTYTINSTILYIIAYLAVYMTYQITVLVMASRWRIDSVFFYYDLQFNDFSPLWTPLNIIIITLSGPLISLIIGIVFMRLLANRFHLRKHTKLLMLWIGLHGYNLFLGAFASGTSFDEGFGYVAAWLYLNIFWKILISLVFLFLLGWIGFASASKFLDTSYSVTRVKAENKVKFLFHQTFLPWLIGGLVLFLVRIPNNVPYDTGNLVTMLFAVSPMLFNRAAKPTKNFRIERRQSRIKWLVFIVMVLLVLAYRLGLDNGLHVQLYYRFIFNLNIQPI